MKATDFCFRTVRTHPLTVTTSPTRWEVQNLVLIRGGGGATDEGVGVEGVLSGEFTAEASAVTTESDEDKPKVAELLRAIKTRLFP
jgi:hypothetical protein